MAFQVKDFLSIVASMVNHIRGATHKITDFNVGSVTRSILEAGAVEMDELYQQAFRGLMDAIPTAIYSGFDFPLLSASAASGHVTFYVDPPQNSAILVPYGTQVRQPSTDFAYATQADLLIEAGASSASVRVVAVSVGSAYNAGAGTITQMVNQVAGIIRISNQAPIVSGRDQETEDQRRTRFIEYVATMSRGTTKSLEYGAKTAVVRNAAGDVVEYVTRALVVEPYLSDSTQPLGYVDIYIFNGVGGTSTEMISECQRIIDGYTGTDGSPVPGWKAAGVAARVHAVAENIQDVDVAISVSSGYTVSGLAEAVRSVVSEYIFGIDIGAPLIRSELIALAMNVPGVIDVSVSRPVANVSPAINAKLMPGTITVR